MTRLTVYRRGVGRCIIGGSMENVIIVVLAVSLAALAVTVVRGRAREKLVLQEQGDSLSRVVGEKLEGSLAVFGDLRQRLGELTQQTKGIEEVGRSISSLQEALRAPKSRGEFGELGLEALLMNHFPGSYTLQRRFPNGKTVDAVLNIGKKQVPIDAKFPFPLDDFKRMVTTQSPDEQVRLRREFCRVIKVHIDAITEYIQPDEGTFDFALMYIPAENIYYETIAQGEICSYCRRRRVFSVSPNTMYVYLQAIVLGLRGLALEKNAHHILERLQRLQGSLEGFQEDYEVIGKHISNAAKKHVEAGDKLIRFSDRLELLSGETPAEELPEGDVETERRDGLV